MNITYLASDYARDKLRAPKIEKFSGGAYPCTPLDGTLCALSYPCTPLSESLRTGLCCCCDMKH